MMQRKSPLLLISLLLLSSQLQATETSWIYESYLKDGTPSASGYVTLVEKEGENTFKIYASFLDECYRDNLKASVARTKKQITITPVPLLRGCDEIRFVINADGSGGIRQVKTGSEWVPDGKERVLTIRK